MNAINNYKFLVLAVLMVGSCVRGYSWFLKWCPGVRWRCQGKNDIDSLVRDQTRYSKKIFFQSCVRESLKSTPSTFHAAVLLELTSDNDSTTNALENWIRTTSIAPSSRRRHHYHHHGSKLKCLLRTTNSIDKRKWSKFYLLKDAEEGPYHYCHYHRTKHEEHEDKKSQTITNLSFVLFLFRWLWWRHQWHHKFI